MRHVWLTPHPAQHLGSYLPSLQQRGVECCSCNMTASNTLIRTSRHIIVFFFFSLPILFLMKLVVLLECFFVVFQSLHASGIDDGRWLQQLYASTNGSTWNNTNPNNGQGSCNRGWDLRAGVSPCNGTLSSWARVSCNRYGRVHMINLLYCNLTGTLPELDGDVASGAMSQLQMVYLTNNQVSGALPLSWSNLSDLQNLYLNTNQLSGPLPSTWASLSSLNILSISYNQLTGSLPASWSGLGNLADISLSNNRLSGSLPESWSGLHLLQSIDLSFNQFSGTLPPSWSQLRSMVNVSLSGNVISGELPSSWCDGLSDLRRINVQLNCMDTSPGALGNATQRTWWQSKSSSGLTLQLQRSSCYCDVGQLLLFGYWCEDCPAGYYCPNTSTSVPCPKGTYNPNKRMSNVTDACLMCPADKMTTAAGQSSSRSCNVSVPFLTTSSPMPVSDKTGATMSMMMSAAALLVGADLSVLDVTTFAAIQSVKCNEVLWLSASRSAASSTSPLKYLLSPFSDLNSSISSLGNIGLIATTTAVHFVVLRVQAWLMGANSRASRAMSKVFYPAVSLTVASVLIPGAVRGAILAVSADRSRDASVDILGAAACVASFTTAAAMVWLWRDAVQRWCRRRGLLVYHLDPMPWVKLLRAKLPRLPVVGRLVLPHGRWTPSSPQRCAGIVFASVAGHRYRWLPGTLLLISTVTVGVSAAPANMDDRVGCTTLNGVLAILSILPAVVIVAGRGPYRIHAVNGFATLNSVLTSLTALITAIALQNLSYAETGVRAIEALATLLYVSSAIRSALLMGLRVAARAFAPGINDKTKREVDGPLNAVLDGAIDLTGMFATRQTNKSSPRADDDSRTALCDEGACSTSETSTSLALRELVSLACAHAKLRRNVSANVDVPIA